MPSSAVDAHDVVTCTAPHGGGGLGQHFAEVVEAVRESGGLRCYHSNGPLAADVASGVGRPVDDRLFQWIARYTPVRFSPGHKNSLAGAMFDRAVARRLDGPIHSYIGFGGQSLLSFERARRLGARELILVAANSHVDNVFEQHQKAYAAHPVERSWLNPLQVRRTRREYEMADVILVASEYTRQSFLAHGVTETKLRRIHYQVNERFVPPSEKPADGVFRIVSTGSLTVAKGIPVLIDAFARFDRPDAELTLVGGWGTRGMRRYLQSAMARDPRIRISPGDPLPHLHRANVCVHPTWEDGYAYAPMEAMHAGVMVIVTEDTGMKEHVREGENGFVIPTGNSDAIVDRLRHLAAMR